jgi:hypothetical protein
VVKNVSKNCKIFSGTSMLKPCALQTGTEGFRNRRNESIVLLTHSHYFLSITTMRKIVSRHRILFLVKPRNLSSKSNACFAHSSSISSTRSMDIPKVSTWSITFIFPASNILLRQHTFCRPHLDPHLRFCMPFSAPSSPPSRHQISSA